MKKYLVYLMMLLFSFGVSAEKIQVLTEHLPPFQIASQGKLVGGTSFLIVRDMLRLAGQSTRVEVMPWARAYDIALKEKNTIIFSILRTPERESLFKWIGVLKRVEARFYTSSSNHSVRIEKVEDALQYKAVVVRGSSDEFFLKSIGFAEGVNLFIVKDYKTVWSMIHKQRADITYAHVSFEGLIENTSMSESDFCIFPLVINPYKLYVAASLNTSDQLVLKLQDALVQVNGTDLID